MNNKKLSITLIVLSLTIVFITVGYAAYSTVLNINGTAKINKSVWSVHYLKDSINVLSGTDSGYTLVAPTSIPVLNSDQTGVSFETELSINESTAFTVDVINDGTFNARVNSINLKVASKSENDANYTTLANVGNNKWSNDYLDFYVVWDADNKNILDTLDFEPSTTKKMRVVVRYKQPENDKLLPSQDMYFKFDIDVEYTQTSSLNQNTTIQPKVTEVASSSADFVNIIQNHQDDQVVIRVNDDIDLTEYDAINVEGNTIIEFNGHTLTTAPNAIKAKNGGVLTLEDSTGKGGITADRGAVVVEQGGTLVVNGGTYKTTNNTRGSGINAKNGSKIVFNDGVVDAAYYALGSDGSVDVTINGGEFKSSSSSKIGTWAYCVNISGGKFTMNGGKISGVHGGLGFAGNAAGIINNGEIYESESEKGADDAFYDIYSAGTSTVKIYNGTFINDGTRVAVYTDNVENAEAPKRIQIYGGKFIAKGNELLRGTHINVTGGKFSHDVSSFLASGSLNYNETTKLYEYEA